MASSENPYASPFADTSVDPTGVLAPAEVEEVRRRYLSREASIRSVGSLYYMSGTLMGFIVLAIVAGTLAGGTMGLGLFEVLFLLFYLAMAVLSFVLGAGLRRLDARVKIPVVILSVLGLLWVPIGTLINGYILYLMLSSKSKVVLSPYYHEIIAQTPHIKYRTSLLAWIVLIILLLVIVAAVVGFLLLPVMMDRMTH